MKKFTSLTVVLISFVLSCCTAPEVSKDDIDKIYDEIDALKTQVSQINTNISSMQTVLNALQNQDYVTAVIPINRDGVEIGFTINFQKSGAITIYHGRDGAPGEPGANGATPVVGARQHNDGEWYWTLNGEWLKDDAGSMVRANSKDGITPEMKIEGGYWYVSYDNGANWTNLGKATNEADASLFKSVDAVSSDQYVSLFLADNTELKLQRYAGISIVLSEQDDMEILPGQTVTISYLVNGASGTPKVSVASVGGWLALVNKTSNTEGTISVTAPNPYADGSVTVLASEGTQTVMEILTFKGVVPEAVDLGLSVKWASCNVGATTPEEYGDYFAWGETETHYEQGHSQSSSPVWKTGYSDGYDWTTYKWCNGSYNSLTKYCTQSSYGNVDNITILEQSDDVAHVKWGSSWRMPTEAEFKELISNCTWTWTTQNGVKGYKVTSKKSGYTSKSIFLPAAGYRDRTYLSHVGSRGYFWSSSLGTGSPGFVCGLDFNSDCVDTDSYYGRCLGLSVRPVSE